MSLSQIIEEVKRSRDPQAYVAKRLATLRGELIALQIHANSIPWKDRVAYVKERSIPIANSIRFYERLIKS